MTVTLVEIEPGQRRLGTVFGKRQTVRIVEASCYLPRQWVCTLEPAGTVINLDETELGDLIDEPQSAAADREPARVGSSPLSRADENCRQTGDDVVTEASKESFPASDPPAWTSSTSTPTTP